MAVLQSNYAATIATMVPGQVFNGETSNRVSRTVEDATAIPFGKFVFNGVNDNGCTLTPTAGKLIGVTIENKASVNTSLAGNSDAGYPQYATAPIMTLGVIAVAASVAVNKSDQVYVTSAGLITNVSTSNTICPGWLFDATISAAGNVPVARR